jgi:hypothetical protein
MSIPIENGMCMADDGVGGNRFEGYDLATKYGWMQAGQGADAVRGGVDALHRLGARYGESQRVLRQKMAELRVSWQGGSADAAAGAMTKLAGWVSGAGESATGGGTDIDQYGSSFARMKPKIPNPADAGAQSTRGAILDAAMGVAGPATGLQSAYAHRLAVLDQQANAALYAHQSATQAALASFPLSEAPPPVTAGTGGTASVTPRGGQGVGIGRGAGGVGVGERGAPGGAAAGGDRNGAGGGAAGGAGAVSGGGAGGGLGADAGAGAPAGTHSAGWTPLMPVDPAGAGAGGAAHGGPAGGLTPSPGGGFVPTPSTNARPAPELPPLAAPPMGGAGGRGYRGGFGGAGFGGAGHGGPSPIRPLASRGGPAVPAPAAAFGESGPSGGAGAGRGGAGIGGMPMGGMGAGTGRGDKEHRNKVFLRGDELFVVPLDDDVTGGVIGAEPGNQEGRW